MAWRGNRSGMRGGSFSFLFVLQVCRRQHYIKPTLGDLGPLALSPVPSALVWGFGRVAPRAAYSGVGSYQQGRVKG